MMLILVVVFLIIDIVSKLVVSKLMDVNDSIIIIKNFFNITYVRNTGAAFSIFAGERWLLLMVSIIIISIIFCYVYKNKLKNKLEMLGYSMILGGAIGNFIDRIVYGYVIDFFDFYIFGYDYPIFNMADTFIFIGVLLLIKCMWRCRDGNQGNR